VIAARRLSFRPPVRGIAIGLALLLTGVCVEPASAQRNVRGQTEDAPGADLNVFRSRGVILTTDLTEEQAEPLLEELDTMLTLVGQYFRKPLRKPIPLVVWKDPAKWDGVPLPPEAMGKMRTGGGITLSTVWTSTNRLTGQERRTDSDSTAYAEAGRGVPLHEAVHAYCNLTFGGTGPVWFSEGLAELGGYFRKGDVSVRVEPYVLKHLQTADRQSLSQILDPTATTGDSWQNYSWRWALAHLLAYNPNYRDRYRPLGVSLMSDGPLTFASVYGPMQEEIRFEYDFFLDVLDQGVRPDLIAWDWKSNYREARPGRRTTVRIEADHGWQPGGYEVEAGQVIEYEADGEWSVGPDRPRPPHVTPLDDDYVPEEEAEEDDAEEIEPEPVTADGGEDGRGRLVGAIFGTEPYVLHEEFELGAEGSFTVPQTGQLMLRCRDNWGQLDDNDGRLRIKLTVAK